MTFDNRTFANSVLALGNTVFGVYASDGTIYAATLGGGLSISAATFSPGGNGGNEAAHPAVELRPGEGVVEEGDRHLVGFGLRPVSQAVVGEAWLRGLLRTR